MSTIVIGDLAEGQKHWSTVAFMKTELARIYAHSNPTMQTWKFLSANVNVHIRLLNGKPHAVIYAGCDGYEFTVPLELLNAEYQMYNGVGVFKDSKHPSREIILADPIATPGYGALPVNTWYSTIHWVTGSPWPRYRNRPLTYTAAQDYLIGIVDGPRLFTSACVPPETFSISTTSAAGTSKWLAMVDNIGTIFVYDRATKAQVFAGQLTWPWPVDPPHTQSVNGVGFWSFNRAGTKACTVMWESQYNLFHPEAPIATITNDAPIGWRTSFVVEIEFKVDGDGNFTGIENTQIVQTDDFCFAADYDWTTENNELVVAVLSVFDYRVHKAVEWTPGTPNPDGAMYLKTTISVAGINRPNKIYHVTGYDDDGLPVTEDITSQPSAIDMWLKIGPLNGDVFQSLELVHNKDYFLDQSSNGTWYEMHGGGVSFTNTVSGLDMRVRGLTAYSSHAEAAGNPDSVYATLYGQEWFSGSADLPKSTGTVYPSNYYRHVDINKRFRILDISQTIAAVPYLTPTDGKLYSVAVYAPSGNFNPDLAIDFMIDKYSKLVENYHRDTYNKIYNDRGPPLNNRYFVAGAWTQKKDRN